jgi:hypothetical protein
MEVLGKAPLDAITDSNGIARIFVDSSHAGQPGFLIVEAKGYEKYAQNIDLIAYALPDVVVLERAFAVMPTSTFTPTSTPTSIHTPTGAETPVDTPAATNTPTLTPSPTPSYIIEFRADKTVVNPGEWVIFRWHVENVQAVYLDWKGGVGAPGEGWDSRQMWETTDPDHTLRVVLQNGETVTRTITITVRDTVIDTPTSIPFSGRLAIPVRLDAESKIYVTGFDGQGINGPEPVSLSYARQPMFSWDGQSIVVNGTKGDLLGLFVTDNKGQAPIPINDRDSAYWPVWSPDDSEIMFAEMGLDGTLIRQPSQGAFSASDFTEVRANNSRIGGKNILWSDDNRLVFWGCAVWLGQPGECGIWVTDADDINPVRILITSGWPMDAKNGLLTYMSAEDGDWDVYLVSLDGGQPENITKNDNQDGLAAIAPDGKSIAYISDESGNWALWAVTLSSREKRRWFDIDPHRGTINTDIWAEERMSWTR